MCECARVEEHSFTLKYTSGSVIVTHHLWVAHAAVVWSSVAAISIALSVSSQLFAA